MRAIWKFKLDEGVDCFAIDMPKGASILALQLQNGAPCLWALVPDVDARCETRTFRLYGTGLLIPEGRNVQYIGTFQQPPYVFHLFEETP